MVEVVFLKKKKKGKLPLDLSFYCRNIWATGAHKYIQANKYIIKKQQLASFNITVVPLWVTDFNIQFQKHSILSSHIILQVETPYQYKLNVWNVGGKSNE